MTVASPLLQRFIDMVRNNETVETIYQKFANLDHNKDGELNIDGFKAAMLDRGIDFKPDEAQEIFGLVQINNMFHYANFITKHNPGFKHYHRSNTVGMLIRQDTPLSHSSRQNLIHNTSTGNLPLNDSIMESH